MTKEKYEKIYNFFISHPKCLKLLKILNKITTYIGYAAYFALLIYLIATKNDKLVRCIAVPAIAFALTTVIRSSLNFPRPYEKLDITPLIKKDTKGKSFPSRHTACISVIAFSWLYVNIPAGIFMCFVTLLIMIIRPLAGIHFPKDVLAGLTLSGLCAIIGYVIL